jgi:flagellar basal-body rod protein FlgF/flagellar basal-body rod protein FlgG
MSGMQARLAELDRIAADLANISTAGYKTERTATYAAERDFAATLQSAVDVADGGTRTDLRPGTLTTTGRALDVAIDGPGFFAVETAHGVRYTRSGNFSRRTDGTLVTVEGEPVLDAQYRRIRLGSGPLEIDASGTVNVGGAAAGRIQVWHIDEPNLIRETGSRFRPAAGVTPAPSASMVVAGAIEQANVSMVDRMATLTEVTRSFEALQRGISVLMNDVDSRAIMELGRR